MSFRSTVGHGEASGAQNGVQMQLHWLTVLELKSLVLELQATNSIGQIHLHAVNGSQYYRRTLTIPMLDHLITELDNSFGEAAAGVVGELEQILPSELVSTSVQLNPNHFTEDLQL